MTTIAKQHSESGLNLSSTSTPTKDVMISFVDSDREFAAVLRDAFIEEGLSYVFGDPDESDPQMVLDCKLLVVVLSESAVQERHIIDEVSLAYVSNTPMFPIGRAYFNTVAEYLDSGMKLMLAKINWTFFVKEGDVESKIGQLIADMKRKLDFVNAQGLENIDGESEGWLSVNRQWSTGGLLQANLDTSNPGFWDRHFNNNTEVTWNDFREQFVNDYKDKVSEQFGDREKWVVTLIYQDIFELRKSIRKETYDKFCGCVSDKETEDMFYGRLTDYAIGKFAMREVFGMDSTVRLTAVMSLAQFQTPAVRNSLLDLLTDSDPNIRAVAALALGRTGTCYYKVIDNLIKAMVDEDRFVRQSAVISLGKLKAEKAIPHILESWRNDPINDVRQTAEIALSYFGKEHDAVKVTKMLSNEMSLLKKKTVTGQFGEKSSALNEVGQSVL